MEILSVEILNPKAKDLLMNMAELNLINIKPRASLEERLEQLRRNEQDIPSEEEITEKAESVRKERN
ncbi:MAG: hypothetical protein LBD35_03125 [Prevotellaceae bacterium]|jgi:hypothetical protein|nr:hypothetical protein [Prevotellaceae bacterium]